MSEYVDAAYPGPRGVPLHELPRGLVPPPPYVLEEIAWLKTRTPHPWPRDYEVMELNYLTLFYYFENIDVAYRSTNDGPEVIAVGMEEIEEFLRKTPDEKREGVILTVPG